MEIVKFNLKKEWNVNGVVSVDSDKDFNFYFKAEEELFTTVGFEIVSYDMHIESKSDHCADLAKLDNGQMIRTVTLVSGDYSKTLRITITMVRMFK